MQGHKVSGAIIGAMYWVPVSELSVHRVRDHFTIKKSGRDYMTKAPTYSETPIYRDGVGEYEGYIGLPIAEGMRLFPCDDYEERLSRGTPFTQWTRKPDPNHPLAAPGQGEFMGLTLEAVQENYATFAQADTGTGKTAVALNTAASLGMSTLVLVPLERLRLQWIRAAMQHLGMKRDDIGEIVGPKCQFRRPLVIGMMKSFAVREYPPEVYSAFGFTIVDEVHNTGADLASRTQGLFNSEAKLALTAGRRKDGGDRVYISQYGAPAFSRSMPGLKTDVLVWTYVSDRPISGDDKPSKLISICYDGKRNRGIAKIVATWHGNGHFPLILVDHVRHAEVLRKALVAAGIPDKKIGMYCGEQEDSGVREKTNKAYLDWVEKHAPVVIATTGMMKEGIDMPRLDRGIDASPNGDLLQGIGRIRRIFTGKERAVWVTPRDFGDKLFEGLFFIRTKGLAALNNVEVHRNVSYKDILAWR